MPAVPSFDPDVIISTARYLLTLATAGALGAALGLVRPVRRALVPRSPHVVQTQILLAIVGALIIIVVGENLARAFAIVGAAGLIRYRARIRDPKDAGVMLVALATRLDGRSGDVQPRHRRVRVRHRRAVAARIERAAGPRAIRADDRR